MLKQNLLLILTLLAPGCSCKFTKEKQAVPLEQREISLEQIQEIIDFNDLKNHNKAIVKFYTDWCGACKKAQRPFAEMQSQYPEVKFFAFNMEKGNLNNKLEIQGFPTFITFENGKEGDVILGFNQEKINQALKNLMEKNEEKITKAEPQILKIKNKQEFEQAIKDNKKVIIKFYGDWCSACQMIAEEFEELSQKYGDKIKFIEVEITHNEDLAGDIRSIPTFKTIENGTEKGSFSGANKEKLQTTIQQLAD